MKRIIAVLILLFLFPLNIMAKEGIDKYYIEMDVLDNGDVLVKELFSLTGNYNGYERIIEFKNPSTKAFDGSTQSFLGSDIYNADNINLIKIKGIDINQNMNFDYLYQNGDNFTQVLDASVGEYGKYTISSNLTGYSYKIYNPSSLKKAFYLEYKIENLGVVHNDVAEIAWNIFSDLQNEFIRYLEMRVNIPNNKNELRVWGHGPLNGETDIINKQQLKLKIENLNANTPIDIRFVFDKNIISNSNKRTSVNALEKIIEVETIKADEANKIREEARKEQQKIANISLALDIVKIAWLIGLAFLVRKVYVNHDKEYESEFKTNYFRDFPANYAPSIVGYLIDKKINAKEMSATILDLMARKVITYEEYKRKQYRLIYVEGNHKLTKSEEILIKMLFKEIGDQKGVTIKEINSYARRNYEKFLSLYDDWKFETLTEAYQEDFFEENSVIKGSSSLYSVFGVVLVIFTFAYMRFPIISILVLISGIIAFIYFITFIKRTKKGNDHYQKWMGLKRFLNDFGNFKDRDLPHINLWEKYLVYAVVFGNAKKLAKKMTIKFNEMPQSTYTTGDFVFDIYYFNMLSQINNSIVGGIDGAVSSALSSKTASQTRSSSGSGFGGGFSGGGGSFGGGGGGGRF